MLTQERLKELFSYDPKTGEFRRLKSRFPSKIGCIAGSKKERYYQIQINHKEYLCHRLAWLYMTGSFPVNLIDHKNGDGFDNRFENLREATQSENNRNRVRDLHKKSGLPLGVYKVKHRYRALINNNGNRQHLGYFDTVGEASLAYQTAAKLLHGEFTRNLI